MNKFGNLIDECIKETVNEVLLQRELPDVEYIETDNLGEVVEKLSILHTRMWMLEDAIQEATTDSEIAELNIPTGIPLVYELDSSLKPINVGGKYLDPQAAVNAAAAVANQGKH
jgi:hypothetical protein